MSHHDPMSHGAVWCEQHDRWECSKRSKRRAGERCHASAIRGTETCRHHAGKRTDVAKAQGEAITAWSALSGQPTVSATEAVLGMLQMSWLRVHLYAGLLREQVDGAQGARQDALSGPQAGGNGSGGVGAGVGLVGHTYGAVKDVGVYATGEAVRGLAQLEAAERDRCVRYAKTAHDMGIAEQQVEIAKQQADVFAGAFLRVLDGMDLAFEDRAQAAEMMARELRVIEGAVL